MKKLALMFVIAAIGFTACKKEESDSGSGSQTNQQKIVGLWMGDEIEISITAPPPVGSQTQKEDISYFNIEFKSDGTVEVDSLGVSQTGSTWSLINNNRIVLDSDTFDIKVLNDSQFHFGETSQEDVGGGIMATVEQTIKLKK